MPQQLIYTSAQRGVVAGRSGYCTVARSAAMRDALMLQLEKLSYYQHLSLSGGQDRRISACRFFEIRGTGFHVLSRIQDAGLDFTGRSNFLAHHLIFTPEEIRQFPPPPMILRSWNGWVDKWTKDPAYLENEDWGNLAELTGVVLIPGPAWQGVTGDAANGYGLLELRPGASLRVDNLADDQVLSLFAESLELLELRDPRKDFRTSAWKYTFTTAMQEQDNPADFRWRCLHSDNPAAARFAGPDCRPLADVRVTRCTNEERTFAQAGRQPPRFVTQPQSLNTNEGQAVHLTARAEGVPAPSYQWFTVDKNGAGQPIPNANGLELVLTNPPFGISRYSVQVTNSLGQVTSEVAKVECNQKPARTEPVADTVMRVRPKDPPPFLKSAEAIDSQRTRLAAEEAARQKEKQKGWKKFFLMGAVLLVCMSAVFVVVKWGKSASVALAQRPSTNASINNDTLPPNPPIVAITSSNISNTNPEVTPISENNGRTTTSDKTQKRGDMQSIEELPAGWNALPIGKVTNPYKLHRNTSFDLSAGAAGFPPSGDNLWFVCKSNVSANVSATLQLGAPFPTNSICGVMVRESDKPDAIFQFIGYNPGRIVVYSRDDGGKLKVEMASFPSGLGVHRLSFQIQWDNTNITSTYAYDGILGKIASRTNTFWKSGTLLGGMAISSGSLSDGVTAKFDSVQIDEIKY